MSAGPRIGRGFERTPPSCMVCSAMAWKSPLSDADSLQVSGQAEGLGQRLDHLARRPPRLAHQGADQGLALGPDALVPLQHRRQGDAGGDAVRHAVGAAEGVADGVAGPHAAAGAGA